MLGCSWRDRSEDSPIARYIGAIALKMIEKAEKEGKFQKGSLFITREEADANLKRVYIL